jgi:D-sedoheptulose 7-phosphate isomerase
MDYLNQIEDYLKKLQNTISTIDRNEINQVLNVLTEAYHYGSYIYTMGNGGSASTASHFVCDFIKGISYQKEKKFKTISLNDNVATMMAIANDISYDEIFREQLKNFLQEKDIVIGISGSGNSPNVINAIEYANDNDAITIGLSGYDGGKLKKLAQYSIHVNINDMQITEDIHMVMDHLIMKVLKKSL